KQLERARQAQEDRIDGIAPVTVRDQVPDLTPQQEEIRNDLLAEKEARLAPIADTNPVVAETPPVLGQSAPEELRAEVQAAVAEAQAVAAMVEQTVGQNRPEQNH
ncbi:MAG: hypothetical protein N3B01_02350, partial [Verrucomicrobiae bacterium]|nr:hypothetical protein [Verrucomicrobiae bacterium]